MNYQSKQQLAFPTIQSLLPSATQQVMSNNNTFQNNFQNMVYLIFLKKNIFIFIYSNIVCYY